MTEKNYGETFRKIRKSKGFTVKEVTDGIVSPQFLNKFEKGDSKITVDNLTLLLNRIFISWKEFMQIHDGNTLDQLEKFSNVANQLIYSKKYYELDQLAKQFEKAYESDGFAKDLHLSLIIKAGFYYNINKTISDQDIKSIRKHLQQIDNWYEYENFIFGSFIHFLPAEDVMLYYKRVARNFERQRKEHIDDRPETVQLITFIVSFFVDRRRLDLAQEVINESREYMEVDDDPTDLFYRVIYKSKVALIKILQGNVAEGKAECEGYIQALKLIGNYPTTINSLFIDLNKALSEVNNSQNGTK
ncbi:helix-turn-helix domain-containing protein [Enterococcus montenegrensis]|uniref:Rgg/GadR/MutR family transcriptional regulator n=1 Tax=Enterococcus montenegrensis TaxID=3031993 RepID=UPI00249D9520|nr:Rgg/GadR/MutR family transcriptional regulator [Enterococcus montenegrensis]WHA09395.1 helix-turn-helix domain-containing protein [Enterococcus montenegrensis]